MDGLLEACFSFSLRNRTDNLSAFFICFSLYIVQNFRLRIISNVANDKYVAPAAPLSSLDDISQVCLTLENGRLWSAKTLRGYTGDWAILMDN